MRVCEFVLLPCVPEYDSLVKYLWRGLPRYKLAVKVLTKSLDSCLYAAGLCSGVCMQEE